MSTEKEVREVEDFRTPAGETISLLEDSQGWSVACYGPDNQLRWEKRNAEGVRYTETEARAEFDGLKV